MNQKAERANKFGTLAGAWALILVFGGLSVANIFYTPQEVSVSERRLLATFPALFSSEGSLAAELNPDFADEFETWAMDSFVYREAFRGIKAGTAYRIFHQGNNNGIYLINGHAGKLETLNEDSVRRAGEKIALLIQRLPEQAQVWYSLIPDKGYYLNQEIGGGLPGIDYDHALALLQQTLGQERYLDILDSLSADDFYRTDLHWAQEKLVPLVQKMITHMGMGDGMERVFDEHVLEPFLGVYYGQAAMPLPAEQMTYLRSVAIDSAVVKTLDTKMLEMVERDMYNLEAFEGIDPYDLFLDGAQPLITIENPKAQTDQELFIFRDSFGSSIAPLFTSAYAKITLIDLRYLDSRLLDQLVDFGESPQVLFLYSAQILNNSDTLLVQ